MNAMPLYRTSIHFFEALLAMFWALAAQHDPRIRDITSRIIGLIGKFNNQPNERMERESENPSCQHIYFV